MKRRAFVKSLAAAPLAGGLVGCAAIGGQARPQVAVVGGGYGGATAAKYLRLWSDGAIDVTLVEPNAGFVSCPLSNLVLGGSRQIADLSLGYETLARRHGVTIVRASAQRIDAERRLLALDDGRSLRYDRLVLSPGVELLYDSLPGMMKAGAQDRVLHAWKAGAQTVALRKQLEAMPDGGVFVMSVPPAPYRCPPGPYERACQVAHYFSRAKPRAKVILLDANDDVVSKGALFRKVWAERYAGIVDYRPKFAAADVDVDGGAILSEFGDRVKGDVLNVIPPQRAGRIAFDHGLANINRRWCEVDFTTFESTRAKNVHVLGDAIQTSAFMPKSGHMANQHAKVCAAAIVDLLAGRAPKPSPVINNTCYSFVSDREVIHVASVHAYDAAAKTLTVVPRSGGLSVAPSELEGAHAMAWARNIWADMLG